MIFETYIKKVNNGYRIDTYTTDGYKEYNVARFEEILDWICKLHEEEVSLCEK